MALNPNYEAIGKAFTTQYYQVLQGFLLIYSLPLPTINHAASTRVLRLNTLTFKLVENLSLTWILDVWPNHFTKWIQYKLGKQYLPK